MHPLTSDYLRTRIKKPDPVLTGLDAYTFSLAGRRKSTSAVVARLLDTAQGIDALAPEFDGLSDAELQARLTEFRAVFRRGARNCETVLPRALAALREAAQRCLGLRPFPVQLAGALALYRGYVAEMATGEGKTLTAALAAVVRGWSGLPCHVITANDYLAARDARWASSLYAFAGVTVGCVTGEMDPAKRREGHARDVTYTTSKEIVADFLRDRLSLGTLQKAERRSINAQFGHSRRHLRGVVMRGIHTAIVDEADCILIDEAVTPLIISRAEENEPFVEACRAANAIAAGLQPDIDYRINLQHKDVELLPALIKKLGGQTAEMPVLLRSPGRREELVKQALNAREFFHRDAQYVIQDGKVVIVDEFTGRLMPMRTWRAGLHQMVEAKENLKITAPSETMARLSFQRFFRFFHHLSGMTGTGREATDELWNLYSLPVLPIPPNKPCQRIINSRRIFKTLDAKWQAIVEEICAMHAQGRPVLIGTRSVLVSEELAQRLARRGLHCNVLNAVRHLEEAQIVERAGEKGAITVATNMAGRGTDIKLGMGVAQLGGLHVIVTECHESGRIDRQLYGRGARQGDPGSATPFVSFEDELMRRYLPPQVRIAIENALDRSMPGAHTLANAAVTWAQNTAQRQAFRRRRGVLKTDTWLDDSLSFAPGEAA